LRQPASQCRVSIAATFMAASLAVAGPAS